MPTRTGRPGVVHLDDLVDQGQELAGLVAEDQVRLVVADHRPVRRDGHDLELVDLVELLGLGHGRAGHAGQLGVEAEVVLEGDRGQGHGLALDVQPFLGLDGLVEALAPAAAGHLAAGELVDDDDLAVLDDVVAVALVEGVGLAAPTRSSGPASGRRRRCSGSPRRLLHLGDAFLGRRDGLLLEVDEVVAALLRALGPRDQARHQPGEEEVLVGRLLGLAADDERRPGLVDEDVVHLVDDGEVALALDPLVQLRDHVVAQVVEAELVVGAVGDVGLVGLAPRARPQVDEPLVVRRVARLEQVRRVVGDDADRQAQEVVDRAHPLGVAAGQVVVDGDDVDAPAGQAVEGGGQRRDQRLALAGLHLGDPALVQDDAADQLDVEVAHPEGPLHRLARRGEDLGQDLVHGVLDALVLALEAVLLELAAALQLGVVALVVGGLLGSPASRISSRISSIEGADLRVGARLHLRLQLVDPLDEGFDAPELPVVRVDEAAQEAKHWGSRSLAARVAGHRPGPRPRRRRPSASADGSPPVSAEGWAESIGQRAGELARRLARLPPHRQYARSAIP